MNLILTPRAVRDLRAYAYHVAVATSASAALREWVRIEAALTEFAAAPVDGVEVQLRDGPRACRRHFVHPFRVYYERHPTGLYVLRLFHHARRPIER